MTDSGKIILIQLDFIHTSELIDQFNMIHFSTTHHDWKSATQNMQLNFVHIHCFNSHFLDEPGLASCPLIFAAFVPKQNFCG